ncbi:Coronatine-insensitive protein 1 [Rhynchospora pubera]|uniref:Coronatine-insensitive protein 1 n=1 Tax=Rhynchospora pubera TaxID=906938 RepID=A0AAV8HST7_9POAL|nr:Coronatine-insensitive protein 1 [Rhynchospora pubera]
MNNHEPKLRRSTSFSVVPDEALCCVLDRINDPRDREAISLVCRQWHRIDSATRKHVTIAFCYSAAPAMLRSRFARLESLKLKGKPRAAMYNLIPEDWGGYASPWIAELASGFDCLKELHLRRMVVYDEDIRMLVGARGHALQSLKLDRCSGFSTDGLRIIATNCRCLRTLYLEDSTIIDHGGEWLHDLATSNNVLMHLNFYMTELKILAKDLELLACNCKSLISLKLSECDLIALINFFKSASKLEEFGGGSFNVNQGEVGAYNKVVFPPRLLSLGLFIMGTNEVSVIYPFCASLKKLDLQYTFFLNTEDHCQLIQKCPNLEVLEVRNVIGDRGLEVVSNTCKRLRHLRVERGDDDPGQQNEQGRVTQAGMMSIAVGCRELEYIAIYASDISNAALEAFGTFSSNLRDFRIVLLDSEENITDLPLDNGVRALLRGCTKLGRFAFYLRPGGLSDVGLGYVGEYSGNIRYMLLGNVGESDMGLMRFAVGCKKLVKLELRSCCWFSEHALARAMLQLPSLRYVWVQGYKASLNGEGLREMRRRYWNIEFIPPGIEECQEASEEGRATLVTQPQLLAYYSLAGQRMDHPEYVVPLF